MMRTGNDTSFTRRDLLTGTAKIALVSALIETGSAQAAAPTVLRISESTIGEADPHKPVDYPGSILMLNLYDTLVRAAPNGGVEPCIATSWTVSPDGLHYSFTLRDDVVFHDGGKLSAQDVVFSVTRMQQLKRGFSYLLSKVATVEAPDATSVRFTLSEPFAPFLAALVRVAIVSAAAVTANKQPGPFGDLGDYGQAYLSAHDAGSGAYAIERHEPQQESVLRKIPAYRLGLSPQAPDMVRLRYGLEPVTVRAQMARKELDLTRPPLPPEVLTALSKTPGIKLARDRQGQMFQFKMNMQKAPTDDVNFRKAIALAFDYATLDSLLAVAGTRFGTLSRGPIPDGVMGFDPARPTPKRDLAAARAALAQSKYQPADHPVDLVWMREVAQEERYALLLQQNLAEIGITVNIIPAPWAQIQQMATTAAGTPHLSVIGVATTTPDVDSLLFAEYHSSAHGTYNAMQWIDDPEIDKMLEQGRAMVDPAQRETHYRLLAAKVADMYPAIFLYDYSNVVAHRDSLSAPGLDEAAQAVRILAGNYQFRTMAMSA